MRRKKLYPTLNDYERMERLLSETITTAIDLTSHVHFLCQIGQDRYLVDKCIDLLDALSKVYLELGASSMSRLAWQLPEPPREPRLLKVINSLQNNWVVTVPPENLAENHKRAGDLITELLIGLRKLSVIIGIRFAVNEKLTKSVSRANDQLHALISRLMHAMEREIPKQSSMKMYYREDEITKALQNCTDIDIREDVQDWWTAAQAKRFTHVTNDQLDKLASENTVREFKTGDGSLYSPRDISNWVDSQKIHS